MIINFKLMIVQYKGVQSRIILENQKVFFVPRVAYSFNYLLGDMASSVPHSMIFIGVIQIIYSIFSVSTEKWDILL